MGWYDSIKRYIWDDETTPHLIRVDGLSKSQARKELFVYTLFLSILFALIALVSLTGAKSGADFNSFGIAIYAFSVFCSAVVLGMNKVYAAAVYAASAPLAVFLYILADGLGASHGTAETVGLLIFSALWFRYALRINSITKAYPAMRDQSDQP